MKYVDPSGRVFDFSGVIQVDETGSGKYWSNIDPQNIRPEVMAALSNGLPEITSGATANIGNARYRAVW